MAEATGPGGNGRRAAAEAAGWMEAQRRGFGGFAEAWTKAASGYQKLAMRQTEMMGEAMAQMADLMQDVRAKDDQSKPGEMQIEFVRRTMERAVANMKEIIETASRINAEALDAMMSHGRAAAHANADAAKDVVEDAAESMRADRGDRRAEPAAG